jgi:HD-GYP domain-containing protein (c-di-GMP phosphodiesterase class II)
LGFLETSAADLPRWVASHSLTVARVMARVVRHAPELRGRPADAVLAALLHDVGMLRAPVDLVAKGETLDTDERGALEVHTRLGGHLVSGLFPDSPWLARAAQGHHERLDGTGYPEGV